MESFLLDWKLASISQTSLYLTLNQLRCWEASLSRVKCVFWKWYCGGYQCDLLSYLDFFNLIARFYNSRNNQFPKKFSREKKSSGCYGVNQSASSQLTYSQLTYYFVPKKAVDLLPAPQVYVAYLTLAITSRVAFSAAHNLTLNAVGYRWTAARILLISQKLINWLLQIGATRLS